MGILTRGCWYFFEIKEDKLNNKLSNGIGFCCGSCSRYEEWLWDLLYEIPLWSNLIAPISVHYNSIANLAQLIARCTIESLDTWLLDTI